MQDTTAATTPVDTAAADAAAEAPNKFDNGVGAIERLVSGDMSTAAWVDLWWMVGWPIVQAVVLIVLVLLVAGWVRGMVGRALRRARVEETLVRFLGNAARWTVLVLGAMAVLGTVGVTMTSFAAVLAAIGFAIGMAMSGMLGNFAAGLMLLIFRPFKIGDVVRAAGVFGIIEEINIFTTTFNTFQKVQVIVPNGKIYNDTIENITHYPVRRQDVNVGTAYDADIDTVRKILENVVRNVEGATQDPAPQVFLDGLGDNSINWQLRVWAPAETLWPMRENLIRDVKKALDEAGVGIPFPQRDVHFDGPIEVRMVNNNGG